MEQELEMQRAWLVDKDKCTFIVLARRDGSDTDVLEAELAAMAGYTP